MIRLDHASAQPLVAQIVDQIRERILGGTWPDGTKLPSIRKLATQSATSPLTVSNAYNRLVAEGLLQARRASGYFVTHEPRVEETRKEAVSPLPSVDSLWLLQRAYEGDARTIQAGCGWLPEPCLMGSGIRQALNSLGRHADIPGMGYGNPYGHDGLREQIALSLARQGINCPRSGIILTHGASQALELSIRSLTRPGDTILVEDPGYCNLFPALRALGLTLHGVPRLKDGPCLESFERLLREKQPKAFVLNTRLHNPTGTSCSAPVLHKLLRIAEAHGILLIEDDIFGDLAPDTSPTLAYLGQLDHVIRISSFSKTISPGLRVGYVATGAATARHILKLKMASSLTSAHISEAIVHHILADGRYRLHLARLREKLSLLQARTLRRFARSGLTPFCKPDGGMFLWMRFAQDRDVHQLTRDAARANLLLAPGGYFSPDSTPSPWLRFNITHCDRPEVFDFLTQWAAQNSPRSAPA
ncbi:aminotransferase-like domain-containing protein [Asaia krungthepensis]|uniref:GntR family transcriptional regulator n=1 Tax=Asaia krungthepensis NRIC 0535 TaxID=1307925 RepID=A0ABQ0PVF7_9PROT|nr:PLP-dependent aminotransferase family protein [Asaia krungthepensis]GBQ82620.1 GntR family transcriptional regulator [Asaia krungthepensis NRIC 0535]